MLLKTKSGRLLQLPTVEENVAINAGIASDSDTYELTDEEFQQLRPIESEQTVSMMVRFDADVIQAFRQAGAGWQSKMNEALRDWLTTHQVR